jgi:hypothetical protein
MLIVLLKPHMIMMETNLLKQEGLKDTLGMKLTDNIGIELEKGILLISFFTLNIFLSFSSPMCETG